MRRWGTPTRFPHSAHPNLTNPSPAPEPESTKWRDGRRTLFHCGDAASTSHAPPGHQTLPLEGPNLHRRAKNQPFPSPPRPTRPPELRKNGGPAGERTWFSLRLFSRRERGFERRAVYRIAASRDLLCNFFSSKYKKLIQVGSTRPRLDVQS